MTPLQKKMLDDTKQLAADLENSIKLMESGEITIRDTRSGNAKDATAKWIEEQKRVLANLQDFIGKAERGEL